jgi:hypothetical protein
MNLATRGKILELQKSESIRAIAQKVGIPQTKVFKTVGYRDFKGTRQKRNSEIKELRRSGKNNLRDRLDLRY